MRIRTDGDNAYRADVIERASRFYGVNKTRSVVFACNDVPNLIDACEEVLRRDDLTVGQKREIAETFENNVRGVEFNVSESVTVDTEE